MLFELASLWMTRSGRVMTMVDVSVTSFYVELSLAVFKGRIYHCSHHALITAQLDEILTTRFGSLRMTTGWVKLMTGMSSCKPPKAYTHALIQSSQLDEILTTRLGSLRMTDGWVKLMSGMSSCKPPTAYTML